MSKIKKHIVIPETIHRELKRRAFERNSTIEREAYQILMKELKREE